MAVIELKKGIMESLDLGAEPINIIKEMMVQNLQGMNSNPILKEWYNREVFQKIEQLYRNENGIDQVGFLYDNFIEIVRKWQADGKMRNDIDAEMIMAIFAAIINIETHKEEVGFQYFPEVLEYLTDFTMKGLLDSSKK